MGFADHNSAGHPIFFSLSAIGSMAGSRANPNIGIMTSERTIRSAASLNLVKIDLRAGAIHFLGRRTR